MSGWLDVAVHVLATLAAMIAAGRLLGGVCRWLGQPPVIGEAAAGVALGPSLLGAVWPAAQQFLLPGPEADPAGRVVATLGAVSHIGVTLYMFLVGLELDLAQLRRQARTALAVSQASVWIPLALGAALGWRLRDPFCPAGVSPWAFAAFLGVAMSMTAFPVLARILSDRGLMQTALGQTALTSAAAQDIVVWCLLAVVVSALRMQAGSGLLTVVGAVALVALLLWVVRPLVERWHAASSAGSQAPLTPGVALAALAGLAAVALAAHWVGIHALVGAFLLGLIVPHDSALAVTLPQRLGPPVQGLLLPAFFALTGLRTEISLVSGAADVALLGVIVLVASAGKLGGAAAAARWCGQSWSDSWSLGVLMNTRGLMELIVLGVGLDLGVIEGRLYTLMVLMALITTVATGPLLNLVQAKNPRAADG